MFDMDGVIAQTEQFHFLSTQMVMKDLGFDLPDSYISGYIGVAEKETWQNLMKKYSFTDDITKLVQLKEKYFKKLVEEHVEPTEFFVEFSNYLLDNKIKAALVSSSNKIMIDMVLKKIGYSNYFDLIISEDDVVNKKPDPEPYLLALERINLKPEECIVIEDSFHGVKAAKLAGIKVIALTTSFSRDKLNEADYIVDNFVEVLDIVKKFRLE